ncbi:MAG: LysR family transcriptional regulator [Sphingomonas sp.]|jgi:DNA-binding transcriptional LysR family regulator|uniref:LysR family transcriptional regulator n=1 Tax=Sphingomonas sp. TaxID=28214 RepID=UPI003561DE52
MIEIQALRYALAAAETGSFSGAASRFGVKQATLARHMQHLEDRLGQSLFRRSTRGIVPTLLGERMLQRARLIVADVDALDAEARALARGDNGLLRIGFDGSLEDGGFASLLRDYARKRPDVEIEAREAPRAMLWRDLERGMLDLILVSGETLRAGIGTIAGWSTTVTAVMSADHPAASVDQLFWSDLRDCSFVVSKAASIDLAAIITARLAGPHHQPTINRQSVRPDELRAFVRGRHVAVSTEGPGHRATYHDLVARPIHDAFGPTRIARTAHWRDGDMNAALIGLLAMARTRLGLTTPAR